MYSSQFHQRSSQIKVDSQFEAREKYLLTKMEERYTIKARMIRLNGLKNVLEELAIFFVWLSAIYKSNFFSIPLFVALLLFTMFRSSKTVVIVRTIVILVLIIDYLMSLTNLSSYNSPKIFPDTLLTWKND